MKHSDYNPNPLIKTRSKPSHPDLPPMTGKPFCRATLNALRKSIGRDSDLIQIDGAIQACALVSHVRNRPELFHPISPLDAEIPLLPRRAFEVGSTA